MEKDEALRNGDRSVRSLHMHSKHYLLLQLEDHLSDMAVLVEQLRLLSLDVVKKGSDSASFSSRQFVGITYCNENYLLKMNSDVAFVNDSLPLLCYAGYQSGTVIHLCCRFVRSEEHTL